MGSDPKRILIVEDEDAIRALLFTVFRRRGFAVDTARNGLEGLEKCMRCKYAVVVLDLMMPLMNGYEFLDQLALRAPAERPVVVVLTAGGATNNLNSELVAGSLRKPFDIELLVDTVSACLQTATVHTQTPECPAADSDSDSESFPRRDEPVS